MTTKIVITMGDATGIGPEIIAKFFLTTHENIIIIGDGKKMQHAFQKIGMTRPVLCLAPDMDLHESIDRLLSPHSPIPIIDLATLPDDVKTGSVDARAGRLAYDALVYAINLAKKGTIDAIVTAPLHKEALYAAGINFPGHTEILAAETGVKNFGMMLVEGALRVVLVSIHLPLREAIANISVETQLKTYQLAFEGARALGIERPKIAVAGVNPHAGEGGLFGREEIEIITPAIQQAHSQGLSITGPYPPDTVFMRARKGEFDVVVAQYHDQGLIPIKINGLEKGVNITLGLPIIRTSVDHGTAFDIAGKGIADPSSLIEAVHVAQEMVRVKQSAK